VQGFKPARARKGFKPARAPANMPPRRRLLLALIAVATRALSSIAQPRDAMVAAARRIAARWDLAPVDWSGEVGLQCDAARVLSWEPRSTSDNPLAWVSVAEIGDTAQLTAWNTPLTDVPHLFARVDGARISCDFRPRLDGGYDQLDAPPSREMFAQKGVRDDYAARYFSPELAAWRDGKGASNPPPAESVVSRGGSGGRGTGSRIAGPLYFDVSTDEARAAATVEEATDYYLRWLEDASTDTASASSWMTSRLCYDRDCLVRSELFTSAVAALEPEFGDAARALAASDAGRLDMIGHNSLGRGGTLG